MRKTTLVAISLVVLGLVVGSVARADQIPYPNMGHYNPVTYSFTAATTGDVFGYFAGTDAAYDNQVGLLDNGMLTSSGFGLDDHSSTIGQVFDFGHVNAGDTLVFDLRVLTLGSDVYSDPSLNVAYDVAGETVGHNHLYSTAYTATSPVFGSTPPGLYIAFEDQQFPNSDYSYADENFVFTNVRLAGVPEPSSLIMLGVGLVAVASLVQRRRSVSRSDGGPHPSAE